VFSLKQYYIFEIKIENAFRVPMLSPMLFIFEVRLLKDKIQQNEKF